MKEHQTLPCAGCGTALAPEATGCQICMRPRTPQEIARGYAQLRDMDVARRRMPLNVAGAALVVLGIGWLAWSGTLSAASDRIGRKLDAMRDPKNYGPRYAGPEETGAPAAAPPAIDPALIVPSTAVAVASPPRPAAAPDPVPDQSQSALRPAFPATAPPAPADGSRVWYGVVYDLITLRPVVGAKLIFRTGSQEVGVATTDGEGHYQAKLDKSYTQWLSVSFAPRSGFYKGLLEDKDPPYRDLPIETRRVVMDGSDGADLGSVPMRIPGKSRVIELNLVPIPSVGPSASALAVTPKAGRRVTGALYDLATLQPVQTAVVTFISDEDNEIVERAEVGPTGEYAVLLPKTGGWSVKVIAWGRRPGQVLDTDPSYRELDEDGRRAAFDSFADGDLAPAPVEFNGASALRLNLFVMPTRWPPKRAGAP